MNYKQATKELCKSGTAHATADSLRAMYARTISFHCRVDGPEGNGPSTLNIYEHLQTFASDNAIAEESRFLLRNPLDAANVAFSGIAQATKGASQ